MSLIEDTLQSCPLELLELVESPKRGPKKQPSGKPAKAAKLTQEKIKAVVELLGDVYAAGGAPGIAAETGVSRQDIGAIRNACMAELKLRRENPSRKAPAKKKAAPKKAAAPKPNKAPAKKPAAKKAAPKKAPAKKPAAKSTKKSTK